MKMAIALANLLKNEETPVQEIAEDFVRSFLNNPESTTAHFIDLLFHIGGCEKFDFLSLKNKIDKIKISDYVEDIFPPISNNHDHFQRRFSLFVTQILDIHERHLLYSDHFMLNVFKVFKALMNSQWDMFRLTAHLLSIRVLQSLFNEFENLKSQCDVQEVNAVAIATNSRFNSLPQNLFKIQRFLQLYNNKSLYHRIADILSDLFACTSLSTNLQVKDRWLMIILSGMRDNNKDQKSIAYSVLFVLLCNQVDVRWQKKLFHYVKSDLIQVLRLHGDMKLPCLRIIMNFSSYGKPEFTDFEMETIYFYLYSSNHSLALISARIVFFQHFVNILNYPFLVIYKLLDISRNSFWQCEDLLVDSLYSSIYPSLTWSSWIDVISMCPEDDIKDLMSLLHAFVRKATTGFISRLKLNILQAFQNKIEYTKVFAEGWFQFLELKKVTNQSQVLSKYIKLIQYFDEDIISKKPGFLIDMGKVCLAYVAVSENASVVGECCKSLLKLRHYSKGDPDTHHVIGILLTAASRTIFNESSRYKTGPLSECLVLAAVKHLETDELLLWDISLEKLRRFSSQKINLNLVKTIICILFQLLMKRGKAALAEFVNVKNKNVMAVNLVIRNCMSRLIALQSVIRTFLDPLFSPDIRKTAFSKMLDLWEFIGPYTPPDGVWFPKTTIDDNDASILVNYTTELMEFSKNCKDNQINDAKLSCCCFATSRLFSHISRGLLDIQYSTKLIKFLGENQIHDDIMVNAINTYINNFPMKWELLSNSIFNAYALLKEDNLPREMPTHDTPELKEAMDKLSTRFSLMTQVLINRVKFQDVRTMRKVSIRLHTVIIDSALKPNGFRPYVNLLYSIKDLLANGDIQFILTCMDEYRVEIHEDVVKYYNFLKQIDIER